LSETVNIRGRLTGVRMTPSASRHALQELETGLPGASPAPGAERRPGSGHAAPADLEALLAAAFERGRAEEVAAAERRAESGRGEVLERERCRVDALLASMSDQLGGLTARVEREAFRFALAVAGRIVKREVTLDDEVALRQIHEALRRVAGVENVRLRVNPRDEALVRRERQSLVASSESVRELVIEPDEKVDPGGCILETSSGTVDARLFTQLEQIEAALFGQVTL
jgi:flagellar assembly protein FliH